MILGGWLNPEAGTAIPVILAISLASESRSRLGRRWIPVSARRRSGGAAAAQRRRTGSTFARAAGIICGRLVLLTRLSQTSRSFSFIIFSGGVLQTIVFVRQKHFPPARRWKEGIYLFSETRKLAGNNYSSDTLPGNLFNNGHQQRSLNRVDSPGKSCWRDLLAFFARGHTA